MEALHRTLRGKIGHPGVKAVLLSLLSRPDPIVREGAIYGLSHHLDSEIKLKLKLLSETDPSPTIREIARETLEVDYGTF